MPTLKLDVCSESEVIFTCSVMESTLEWNIHFLAGDNLERVLFSRDQRTPTELTRDPTGVVYRFMVTSMSPFQIMSTMTTNTPTDLSGARVTCSSRSNLLQDLSTATLILLGKNTNYMSL